MIFPTLVYKCPGEHQCTGGSYAYKPAADEQEFSDLISAGWFETLPEAMAGEAMVVLDDPVGEYPFDDEPPTRVELEQKATELGLKFDGRNSDANLSKRIAETLQMST